MATEKRLIDASEIPELLEKEFARKWRLILDGETHLDNLAEGLLLRSLQEGLGLCMNHRSICI